MTDARTLLVTAGDGEYDSLLEHPSTAGRIALADIYDLDEKLLHRYRGLLLGVHVDQRHLLQLQSVLETFLAGDGKLVFCGHVAYPFLPELRPFAPLKHYTVADLHIQRVADHPIWRGVSAYDLTFRKGVAGFHGRGYNPPPPGSTVINTLGPRQLPLDYEYRRQGGGTVVIHSGNALWNHLDDETTLARVTPQLLDWIEGDD